MRRLARNGTSLVFGVMLLGGLAALIVGLASAAPVKNSAGHSKAIKRAAAPAWGGYLPANGKPAGANWTIGYGDLSNSRFSALSQINASNVQNLHVAWTNQFNDPSRDVTHTLESAVENQPLCCINGMMYLNYETGVVALDPADGSVQWKYLGPTVANSTLFANQVISADRSMAYNPTLNLLYLGQFDGSIAALNAKTGAPVWTSSVLGAGSYGLSAGTQSQPFTVYYPVPGTDGLLLSAPNGGEAPFRGHFDAFDAKTGKLVWRVWNLPDPTQLPYALSWGNPAEAATGGAATWSVPAVDTSAGQIYYGTGNPYPELGRSPGANLWTETLMSVDWKTGAMKWFFQTTHHDTLDFDIPHPPMVLNVPINGKLKRVVAEGSKGGLFYVLDAKNGSQFSPFRAPETPVYDPSGRGVLQNNFTKTQPLPEGAAGCMAVIDFSPAGLSKCGFPADYVATVYGGANNVNVRADGSVVNAANGRPIVGTPFYSAFSDQSYFVFGGAASGGVFGYPTSAYDPRTHNYIACLQNQSGGHSNTTAGSYTQAGLSPGAGLGISGMLSAINLSTNKMSWQYRSLATGNGNCYSGVLATAGNLAFTGFRGNTLAAAPGGNFNAFDATTGKILWTWGIPNDVFNAGAMTYMYKGKQYLAIYHGVAPPGTPGAGAKGSRDQLTVFTL